MAQNPLSHVGSLLADPTRAEILTALMDGRAHTGSELARHVGVAPSTASEHLSKLLDGGMVAVEAQGRHRYFRLANVGVAELLESVVTAPSINPPPPPRAPAAIAYARTCYDHLAGELAVAIYDDLLDNGHLVDVDHHLQITESGLDVLEEVGVEVETIHSARRPKARACLDWTQRRHHLAGAAGAQFLDALIANRWLAPGPRPRSIRVTPKGRQELAERFQLQ